MIKKTIKYSLLLLAIGGLSACTSGRTITINQDTAQSTQRAVVIRPNKQPTIKEEILLGNNGKNSNSALGRRVDVSENGSILGGVNYRDQNLTNELSVPDRNQVMERMPFPTGEYKYVKKRGSSTVSGTIYLENSHTSLKVKGQKIKLWLNPVTSYSRQWYYESYLGGYKLTKTDKRLYNYLKFTYSDNSGKFNFFGVPRGDYYLTGSISCGDECGFNKKKSIRLVREISVGPGVTTVDLMKHVP
ncbi:MAG: Unknown protein [uncultured Sulfurovum sp.]|uniref:Carboxypeptidase regulatory-like domain-containing protein n=1 Tax=uncultured Sulfurovum sp. TaxID=269237 RepID=A0A6S6TDG8_9BACT|nr:MAG: Unknown protein [uncultured Sulfurovum sp.]